jgi:hypothetical protein
LKPPEADASGGLFCYPEGDAPAAGCIRISALKIRNLLDSIIHGKYNETSYVQRKYGKSDIFYHTKSCLW